MCHHVIKDQPSIFMCGHDLRGEFEFHIVSGHSVCETVFNDEAKLSSSDTSCNKIKRTRGCKIKCIQGSVSYMHVRACSVTECVRQRCDAAEFTQSLEQ